MKNRSKLFKIIAILLLAILLPTLATATDAVQSSGSCSTPTYDCTIQWSNESMYNWAISMAYYAMGYSFFMCCS